MTTEPPRPPAALPGIGRPIGAAFARARDSAARTLIQLGATPNRLTWCGFLMTLGAAYCLARGASQQVPYFYSGSGALGWWPLGAALFLLIAGACDMLDGAVARLGRLSTPFGGILDSTLDRFSDMAIYLGCALHFGWHANLTYQALSILALCAATLISYVKARAEDVIDDCSVGFWKRPERFIAILIACFTGHVPALLWQQAVLPLFTVLRRLLYVRAALQARRTGRPAPRAGPAPGWHGLLQPWRHPRGSLAHDLVCGLIIAYLILAPRIWPALLATGPWADPLARCLGH